MPDSIRPRRSVVSPGSPSVRARLAGALLAVTLLAAGCGGEDPAPDPGATSAASDAGGASDGGGDPGASDGGGATVATVPEDTYPVTPAPEDFEAPAPCTGEGAYVAEVGSGPSTPEMPERAGQSLTIEAAGVEGDHAQLTAAIGDGDPRPVEDATIGETVGIDLWTISITSVCADEGQVEYDLID